MPMLKCFIESDSLFTVCTLNILHVTV
jgi:hypothetical protein